MLLKIKLCSPDFCFKEYMQGIYLSVLNLNIISASIVYFSGNMFYIGFGSVKEQPWNNLELLEATRREQEAEERSRDIHNNSTQNDHHHTQHRRNFILILNIFMTCVFF